MFDLLGDSGARAHPICLGVKDGEHPGHVTSLSESHNQTKQPFAITIKHATYLVWEEIRVPREPLHTERTGLPAVQSWVLLIYFKGCSGFKNDNLS